MSYWRGRCLSYWIRGLYRAMMGRRVVILCLNEVETPLEATLHQEIEIYQLTGTLVALVDANEAIA